MLKSCTDIVLQADNTYTAFDPVFLSYHCNMDRLFEVYLHANPDTKFTAGFPLKPFTKNAEGLNYTSPNAWVYSSLGEMAQESITVGYVYATPTQPDIFAPARTNSVHRSTGGIPMTLTSLSNESNSRGPSSATNPTPFIVFRDVVCTEESYQIDVFLKGANSTSPDPVNNLDYVGGLYRMGMGIPHGGAELRNKQRCRKESVLRVIEADHVADKIENGFFQVVYKVAASGKTRVPEQEWREMKGFTGELAWIV